MDPPGSNMYVFKMTLLMCAISAVLFLGVRQLARPAPKTLTKEWQEASNEYLKGQKVEPITGVSSEGMGFPLFSSFFFNPFCVPLVIRLLEFLSWHRMLLLEYLELIAKIQITGYSGKGMVQSPPAASRS